jgi:hypothetical protein
MKVTAPHTEEGCGSSANLGVKQELTNKSIQIVNFYGGVFMKIFVARTNITIQ